MSIKYYHLAKDETPPEEFCAIRDVGGEPSEYVFYVPDAENIKLRELVVMLWTYIQRPVGPEWNLKECMAILDDAFDRICELGIEVDG